MYESLLYLFKYKVSYAGVINMPYILDQIDFQIYIKVAAFSRRDILEKAEKWLAACGECSFGLLFLFYVITFINQRQYIIISRIF